jgi:ribosomal protein S18 acetylase RimI-like enzyme
MPDDRDDIGVPRIRQATGNDAASIHALLVELANATGLGHKLRSSEDDLLRHGFSPQPVFEALLAEQDGDVLGLSLFFYNFSTWRGELGVYVQDLVVKRRARTRGIGKLLIQETVRHAQRRGATHLRLSVEHDNLRAIRFYHRLGLHTSDTECILEADGQAFERLAEQQ